MAEKKFVLIIMTSESRPDVPAGALQLATNMKAFDAELDKPNNLDPANLAFGAVVKPGSFLGQMLMEREGLTF